MDYRRCGELADHSLNEIVEILNGKVEELDPDEDAEAINSYRMAIEHIGYGVQAEYLEQDDNGLYEE